jgi:hypothetical protein
MLRNFVQIDWKAKVGQRFDWAQKTTDPSSTSQLKGNLKI